METNKNKISLRFISGLLISRILDYPILGLEELAYPG